MAQMYNNPASGNPSSITKDQARTDFFKAKAMIAVAPELVFGQFADAETMPRNSGTKIIQDVYVPLLHDANLSSEGINAAGVSTVQKVTIKVTTNAKPSVVMQGNTNSFGTHYAVGEGNTAALALAAAKLKAESLFKTLGVFVTSYAATKTAVEANGWVVTENAAVPSTGNLYGSSRDVGVVTAKMPTLSENGGRVNRVGWTRVRLESKLDRYGFFDEYTADSMDFDSDSDMEANTYRLMLEGAAEINEDALQTELLNSAGLIRFGGIATKTSELTGETSGTVSVVNYDDLMRLDIDLTNNRAPKTITAITGSTNVDTVTVPAARVLIVGSELIPTLKAMTDSFGNPAFKSIETYSSGGYKGMLGEIGAIDGFRIIVAQRMLYWAGAGATVTNNAGYRATDGKYDVFPMLAISKNAFTEIGFRGSNHSGGKWSVMHKKPGLATMDAADPFGMIGRRSVQWFFGVLVQRPEWIGLVKTVAKF